MKRLPRCRAPYDRLWEALDDPRLASLVHAARAEILRVQNYYLSGSRLDAYDIPVATYFPDSAALKDSQLKEDELVTLLANPKHPWQVRMKPPTSSVCVAPKTPATHW
ncbi:hypothetical protein [Verrucomicrobium spinosum]|uniref:hypothetical protein n=1 Tax=Verrucomicrobium spinosum TaxID=2736 RepID=UPI00094635A1|nr:hypothetical protein [Verrucomicrobium spinosum]